MCVGQSAWCPISDIARVFSVKFCSCLFLFIILAGDTAQAGAELSRHSMSMDGGRGCMLFQLGLSASFLVGRITESPLTQLPPGLGQH